MWRGAHLERAAERDQQHEDDRDERGEDHALEFLSFWDEPQQYAGQKELAHRLDRFPPEEARVVLLVQEFPVAEEAAAVRPRGGRWWQGSLIAHVAVESADGLRSWIGLRARSSSSRKKKGMPKGQMKR